MKKPIIILGITALIAGHCFGQTNNNTNSKEMEENKDNLHDNLKNYIPVKEFNIEEFNAKRNRNTCRFVDEEGMEVEQTVSTEYPSGKVKKYWEHRKYPNSGYKFYSEYDANGILVETSISFYGMVTGFICFYNTSGNIINKEDWDEPYKFSIDDLINKMKTQYDIDIVDTRICSVISRGVYDKYNNTPLYSVYLYGDPKEHQLICYVIDGNTGKTLYATTRYIRDDRKSIIDEYFNSLKETK
ncbi:MAG: hypothetical protein FWG38_00380 [Defluviitaleaceae bacterium]|nr:hypothetical protein [Defluviitaleaceae bacterium]